MGLFQKETMEMTQYMLLYFSTPIAIFHTQIFHTPPLASISRLLSSNAFWSIDSSPWRLSCSCKGIQTHGCLLAIKASGKIPILSHHTIFIAQQPHTSTKASLYFFPTYDTAIDTGKWHKPENSPFKERKEQSITVDSKSSSIVLQCTCIEREKKTKRQSETEREVKRLTGVIQNSVRNTTLKRLNQKRQVNGWNEQWPRRTLPAGAPPCSGSGLTGAGFPHPYPVLLGHVGQSVIVLTEKGTTIRIKTI